MCVCVCVCVCVCRSPCPTSWDEGTPIEETLRTVAQLIQQGKVLYFGVSNVLGWQLQKIVDVARELGIPPIVSLQAQYSLLCRWTEWELQTVCQNEGLGLLPWSPLKVCGKPHFLPLPAKPHSYHLLFLLLSPLAKGGWLSGKFKRDAEAPPEGSRVAWAEETGSKLQSAPGFKAYAGDDKVWDLIDGLFTTAEETQHTVAQVALRWLLQKAAVPSGASVPYLLSMARTHSTHICMNSSFPRHSCDWREDGEAARGQHQGWLHRVSALCRANDAP